MTETVEKKKTTVVKKTEDRSHYGKVAIVGPSGTGKSYLSKFADRETTGYINAERKPPSYKSTPFTYEGKPKTWAGFMKNLKEYGDNPDIKRIIIDSQTAAFNTCQREMQANFSGFDIYKNYNREVYNYLELMKNIEKDIIVISHDELVKLDEGSKVRRMATHGKEFEGKIEREYTVVLYTGTRLVEGRPEYFLRTFEPDTSTKVAEGLFGDELEIPNNAKFIFDALEAYYS